MSIESVLEIASSGLVAQSHRINLVSQNLANADSVSSPEGGPYQRRLPVFVASPLRQDSSELGVKMVAVLRDESPPQIVHDPSNPLADEKGNVRRPAINPVLEMVDLIEASRSYEANLSVIESAKSMALKTIDLLQ